METPFEPKVYSNAWERPEWIYAQVYDIEQILKDPQMVAMRENEKTRSQFFAQMRKKFPEFDAHYPKLFLRTCDQKLSKDMLLMLLKKMKQVHEGKQGFSAANQEVIGSAFSLLANKLPQEKKEAIMKTYKDLVEEQKANERKGMEEYMRNNNIPFPTANTNGQTEEIQTTNIKLADDDEEKTQLLKEEEDAIKQQVFANEAMNIIQNAKSQ